MASFVEVVVAVDIFVAKVRLVAEQGVRNLSAVGNTGLTKETQE